MLKNNETNKQKKERKRFMVTAKYKQFPNTLLSFLPRPLFPLDLLPQTVN
jgi:hypothetical protein